ncbi:MAG: gliding motility-associated C-terminal domain-containing protein, partial [Flavobacteriales bacterium]|nr:gliding motility-associated C-terminal domain-containing protein [Flavobacteriales bacterium]
AVGLCDGTFTVLITDGNNCVDSSKVTITSPASLVLSTASSCFGACDGSASVTISGGTAPYTWFWDDPSTQTTATATGLCGGFYTVYVTDANNCIITDTTTIFTPTLGFASIPATCPGVCDGQATATPTANWTAAPYTYLWQDVLAQTTAIATDLCVGWVKVLVTDAVGCAVLDSAYIGEASPINLLADVPTNISCYGFCDGSITYTTEEGIEPFSFTWYNISGVALGNNTLSASGLCAGGYYLHFQDAMGCEDFDTITLIQPPALQTSIGAIGQVECAGICTGFGEVDISGGTKPYAYQWEDMSGNIVGTDSLLSNLCGGKYYVYATDANSCSIKDSIIITEPPKLVVTVDTTYLNCTYHCDGVAAATVTGGWPPYIYQWNDISAQTTAVATGLCAGPYLLKVEDVEKCTVESYDTIAALPADPLISGFSATPNITTIFNTTVSFNNTSTGAVSYTWDFGDGSPTSSELSPFHDFPNVEPGIYDVWLITTNDRSCQDSIMQKIFVRGDFSLFAPSAFTPNQDGLNETFFPKGIGIDEDNFVLYIYDRWGDLIYETDDITKPWDGKANYGEREAQLDVYVWLIATYDDNGLEHEYIGHVTVIE